MVEDANHRPSSEPADGLDSQRFACVRDAVRARLFGGSTKADEAPDLDERYRVIGRIGDGGSSTVWEVEHTRTCRRLAAKVPRADRMLDATAAERLLLEARAIGSISHANVVEVVDVGLTTAGTPFLVMERLVGRPLDAVVREGPVPWERARSWLTEIGAGLAAAHAIGVIHRDLKPSNVMLVDAPSGEPHCKVLDFGLARWPRNEEGERLTRTGAVFGTPGYMSPEQINGAEVSAAADIYALGCLAWELVAGRPAFRGDALGDLLYAQLFEHPDSPFGPKVPRRHRAADAWIRRCMRKRPELRFPSMHTALEALAATARDRRVGVTRERTPSGAARAARRRATFVAFATAAGLVLGWDWISATRRSEPPTSGAEPSVPLVVAGIEPLPGPRNEVAAKAAAAPDIEESATVHDATSSIPRDEPVSQPAAPLPTTPLEAKPRRRNRRPPPHPAEASIAAPPVSPPPSAADSPPSTDRPARVDWTNPFQREVQRTRSATDR